MKKRALLIAAAAVLLGLLGILGVHTDAYAEPLDPDYYFMGWDHIGETFTEGDWEFSYYGTYSDDSRYYSPDFEQVTVIWVTAYKGNDSEVVVPGTAAGKKISQVALSGLSAEKITLSKGIKEACISDCENLTTLKLNSDLAEFDIYSCGKLKTLKANDSLRVLEFYDLPSLESVTLNDKLEKLDGVGGLCDKLSNITLNDNLKPFLGTVGGYILLQNKKIIQHVLMRCRTIRLIIGTLAG